MTTDLQGRIRLPEGVRDRLPGEAADLHRVRRTLLSTLDGRGYQRVMTPSIEYLDVLLRGTDLSEDRMFKLVEPETGQVIALRPDITPQVARMAATALRDSPPPLRLCYSCAVFRIEALHSGGSRAVYQVGAECIGVPGATGDAEALSLLAELLDAAGFDDFTLDLGHAAFLREALTRGFPNAADRNSAEAALRRKDLAGIAELSESCSPARMRPLVRALPGLYGDLQSTTARARSLTERPELLSALDELDALGAATESNGFGAKLSVDLGEVRGLRYHTGVVFQAFVPGPGRPLGGGGRYDGLIARYGRPLPATGFALDLGAVMEALCRRS
jgi:ATP phosphoribosyltransferase regulatory subunit